MLYALGLGGRVVGVTVFCHYPPEVRQKPKIGSYMRPDLESILAMRPDLAVVLREHGELVTQMERLKLPVLALRHNTLEEIMGYVFAPVAVAIGVAWEDASTVGSLLGQKVVLNEFVAYGNLTAMLRADPNALAERSVTIVTYALAGFANFGSIGIMIGGISGIAPERREDLARLSIRSLIGGLLATLMTASIAGVLL
jgi:nucleoside permease NupC